MYVGKDMYVGNDSGSLKTVSVFLCVGLMSFKRCGYHHFGE